MRHLRRKLLGPLAGGAAVLLSACTPADVLNATVPTSGLAMTRNVAYGRLPRQMLDIYRPRSAQGPLPVVVFFYGGAWQHGSRGKYLFLAASLARRGVVVVVPDYRLYPEVTFPGFLADCAQAVVWTAGHIGDYGGDTRRFFLMGHSAGAYNVAMLALDPHYLAAAGGSRDAVTGTITLAGPFDFLPITGADIQRVFAVPDKAATQPINFADGRNHPMLLLAGTADTTVYPRNTESLAAHIRAAGGPVDDKLYPDIGHIGIVLSFAPLFRFLAPALDDTVAFINRVGARSVAGAPDRVLEPAEESGVQH